MSMAGREYIGIGGLDLAASWMGVSAARRIESDDGIGSHFLIHYSPTSTPHVCEIRG